MNGVRAELVCFFLDIAAVACLVAIAADLFVKWLDRKYPD